MIVLDTNVLSELLRPAPDDRVVSWLGRQLRSALFTTAVSRGELMYGVFLLPEGQRRDRLSREIAALFSNDFAERVLAYDSAASDLHARIAAGRRTAGRPISQSDAMIAAVVRSRGATLATRNGRDFEDCGVTIVDPWR